jgi:hypothetical protein
MLLVCRKTIVIKSPNPGQVPEKIPTVNRTAKQIVEFDFLRTVAILLLLHHGGIYNFSLFSVSLLTFKPYIEQLLLGSFVFMAGYLSVHSLEKEPLANS